MASNKRLDVYSRVKGPRVAFRPAAFYVTSVFFDAGPVLPGDPIPILWSLHPLPGSGLDAGSTVTARVFLDTFNAKLFESQPVPLTTGAFGLDSLDQKGLIPSPPNGGVANELYRIGSKTLRLDVTSDKTGAVFSTTADLEVLPAQVAHWGWLGAEGTPDQSAAAATIIPFELRYAFLINHDYKLSGRMNNQATNPNVTMTGSLTLLEAPFGTADAVEVQTAGFTIGPNGQADFLFGPIKQNWTWLYSGIWVRNFSEPLSKTFVYSVRFTFTDSFGNFYSSVVSPLTLTVDVSVSDEKRGYGDGALAALGVGLLCAIFTFGAGFSAAQAIAGGLGNKALDPPAPDPRFEQEVLIGERRRLTSKSDKRFIEVMAALEAVERAFTLFEALGDIHNRLLGARLANDRKAITMQRGSYQATEEALLAIVASSIRLGAEAAAAATRVPDFSRDSLEATLRMWQREGVPSDVRQGLVAEGCSDHMLAGLARALQEPAIVELAQDLSQAIGLMTHSIALAARELHKRTAGILAGSS